MVPLYPVDPLSWTQLGSTLQPANYWEGRTVAACLSLTSAIQDKSVASMIAACVATSWLVVCFPITANQRIAPSSGPVMSVLFLLGMSAVKKQLNMPANYSQRELLSSRHTKMEIAFGPHSALRSGQC